jgi:hypothetical protein
VHFFIRATHELRMAIAVTKRHLRGHMQSILATPYTPLRGQ